MATTKPTKPTDLMPTHFADNGVKNNFSSSKIQNGFSANFDDILQGDNLNYMLDSIGKELNYCETICDFINALPIGKTVTTDVNNKLAYRDAEVDLSGKCDVDGSNATFAHITETYVNGSSGYVLYSNNFCVQWGVTWNYTPTIQLLKSYGNTNYNISASNNIAGDHYENGGITNVTASSFRFSWGYSGCYWTTKGFIS